MKEYISFLILIWLTAPNLHSQLDSFIKPAENPGNISSLENNLEMNNPFLKGDNMLLLKQEYKLTKKVDSAIVTLAGGDKFKNTYSYNSNQKMTLHLVEKWNGNNWENNLRWIYSYSPSGNRISEVKEVWDGNEWTSERRWTYSFDLDGLKTSELEEQWDEEKWVGYARWNYVYDSNGNLASTISEWWNSYEWENARRSSYSYDSNGDQTIELIERWDYIEWINYQKYTYAYNSNGLRNSYLYEVWENDNWTGDLRYTYNYDGNGNLILQLVENFWNRTQWENHSRYTYTFDDNENKTSYLWESWRNNQWENVQRESYTYDFDGNLTLHLNEKWDNNQWVNNWRFTYTYDSTNNVTNGVTENWNNNQWTARDGGFFFPGPSSNSYSYSGTRVNLYYGGNLEEREIGEELPYPGKFSPVTNETEVKFTRVFGEKNLKIESEIYELKVDTIRFLLPPELITSEKKFLEKIEKGITGDTIVFEITTNKGQANEVTIKDSLIWRFPRLLIYDHVVNPPVAAKQQIIVQNDLTGRYPVDVRSFFFMGRSEDDQVGLRVSNTQQYDPTEAYPPLYLNARVFVPGQGEISYVSHTNQERIGDEYKHLFIKQDYIHVVTVFQEPGKKVKSTSPFQIHLAGNVGLPRKLINGNGEWPRGTRLDILWNHVAPRSQSLTTFQTEHNAVGAASGIFKFNNRTDVFPYAIAVLVPPKSSPEGMPFGQAYVRAPDPMHPVDLTTPTAITPVIYPTTKSDPQNLVIDFTQLPYPLLPIGPLNTDNGYLGDTTVAAVIGRNYEPEADPLAPLTSVELPTSEGINSLILDMGSGEEIVNGEGVDFQVFSPGGNYTIAVANTPYASSFESFSGSYSGDQMFDLSETTLSSARYVRITANPSVTLDAVKALNVFMDVLIQENVGPVKQSANVTCTMRRVKAPQTDINPFLQLIEPDGERIGDEPGDFGDATNKFLTDAVIADQNLSDFGFHRFLAKGYDQRPEEQAYGKFLVRLETAGEWNKQNIQISEFDEGQAPSYSSSITGTRCRVSYLFQAQPGEKVNITVKTPNSDINPILELYDPEEFLIAANDDYKNRGRDAALSVTLPANSFYGGGALPNPSTYRIVVSAIDDFGNKTNWPGDVYGDINYYPRMQNGGSFELRLFTGAIEGEEPENPVIDSIKPNNAIRGVQNLLISVSGKNFEQGAEISFTGSGINVKNTKYVNNTTLEAIIDIAADAAIGARDIIVSNPDGNTGNSIGKFRIYESLGTVDLTWNPPVQNDELNPPLNLIATLHQNGETLRNIVANQTAGIEFMIAENNFQEIEPNNSLEEAQSLTGDSPLQVQGSAEIEDAGTFNFLYDDIEDLYKINLLSEGLSAKLDGFSSNCDMYIFDKAFEYMIILDTDDATLSEEFEDEELIAGEFIIGVSINDEMPLGESPTEYTLTLSGDFEGSGQNPVLTGYKIYRSLHPNARETGELIESVGPDITSYTDNAQAAQDYYYQVTAVYNQGESSPSNDAKVTVTGKDEKFIHNLPGSFLKQNYPNPFTSETYIEYYLPNDGKAYISIYNILGKKIKTLVSANQTSGKYVVIWKGKTDYGKKVKPGLYFYRLEYEDLSETKSCIFMNNY